MLKNFTYDSENEEDVSEYFLQCFAVYLLLQFKRIFLSENKFPECDISLYYGFHAARTKECSQTSGENSHQFLCSGSNVDRKSSIRLSPDAQVVGQSDSAQFLLIDTQFGLNLYYPESPIVRIVEYQIKADFRLIPC